MGTPKISKVYYSLTHWNDFRLKLFGEGILVVFCRSYFGSISLFN
jgi:hypothetical protein